MPEAPTPSKFQKIRTGDSDVYAYLPEDYVIEAFSLGARYQKAELTAPKAIESMQALANQISRYDLRLDEPFQALTFLREELAEQAAAEAAEQNEGQNAGDPASEGP